MARAKGSKVILTPEFRVAFPHIFEASAAFEGQEKKYSICMIFEGDADFRELVGIINEAKQNFFGDKPPVNLRTPLRDGNERDPKRYAGFAGKIFANVSTRIRPGLVDANVQPIIEPNDFYAGCFARAKINAYGYNRAGNAGVAFGLRNLQKTRDGESLIGSVKAENDFDALPTPVRQGPVDLTGLIPGM